MQTGSLIWRHLIVSVLVQACLADGDINAAAAVLDTVFHADMPQQAPGQRQCWYVRAQLALAQQDADQALAIADGLIATAANVDGPGERALPRLGLLRGSALAVLGQPGAEAALQAAHDGAAERLVRCFRATGVEAPPAPAMVPDSRGRCRRPALRFTPRG